MARFPRKVMVIGLDGAVPKLIEKWVADGKLPTLAKLMDEGVYGENCLVPFPTITPPGWTTIVTGAWPGTHGITDFHIHRPGEPLDVVHQAFSTRDCRAEYFWDVAEREGKKVIILNWPVSWPPTIKNGIQIGAAGVSVNEWRGEPWAPRPGEYVVSICHEQLFSTEEYPLASKIELKKATGWKNLLRPEGCLEAEIRLTYPFSLRKVREEKVWHLLVQDGGGQGYEMVTVCRSKDTTDKLDSVKLGQWSRTIIEWFETEEGPKEGVFRFKLVELSNTADKLRLYFTPICQLDGWSYPETIASELREIGGLPTPIAAYRPLSMGWIDEDTYVDVWDFQHVWYAEASNYLLRKYKWDIFLMSVHCPDTLNHMFINKMDPEVTRNPEVNAKAEDVMLRLHQSIDRMIKRIIEVADDNTLIIIVSDHGGKPWTATFDCFKLLTEKGLVKLKEGLDVGGERYSYPFPSAQIDWENTRAVPTLVGGIMVNLKGRDPQGSVEPGEEYEKVCDEVIKALIEYVDPKTGKHPVVLALRREDARMIGLHGDMAGDVVCALRGEYGLEHGWGLPTCKLGVGELKGLLIMAGPSIKKGHRLKRTVWLTDIVPTLCHLLDISVPKDTEGAIIYQALEDPNAKLKNWEQLRKNYEGLKAAFDQDRRLAHTYG